MGMEGISKSNTATEKPEGESAKMTRRDFLGFMGAAIASGISRDAGVKMEKEALGEITATDVPAERAVDVNENVEDIPDVVGLLETFNLLAGERYCKERRREDDEKGVYLWELEFQIEGGTAEFGYMRKGRYPVGGSSLKTKIYLTFFDSDGIPEGGYDVAEFRAGEWVVDHDAFREE